MINVPALILYKPIGDTMTTCKARLSRFSEDLCGQPARTVHLKGPLGDFTQDLCEEHIKNIYVVQ